MWKILAGCVALVAFADSPRADDRSQQVALSLGGVIAAESLCGFQYDQAAIQRYIEKNVPERDMEFPGLLNLMVRGTIR